MSSIPSRLVNEIRAGNCVAFVGAGFSAVGPTRLVFRMANVLAADGAAYPMAGALSAAVRGRHQLDRSEYASELGITLEQVDNAEAGRTPLRQLPEPISSRIPWLGIDLTALAADPAA